MDQKTQANFLFAPLFVAFIITIALLGGCQGKSGHEQEEEKPETGVTGDGNLDDHLAYIVKRYDVPAIAAEIIENGDITEKAVSGVRCACGDKPVALGDHWHVGSITKSMTATLAAVLVEDGVMGYDTTITQVFPEWTGHINSEYENVRLDELLSHTAGVSNDLENLPDWNDSFSDASPIISQRLKLSKSLLTIESESARGEFAYSNGGYVVAAAMMERLTGIDYETLLTQKVFSPLQMNETGFGAPDTGGAFNEPVGHEWTGSKWVGVDPATGTIADNPPVLGPAGRVNTTLDDMAKYLSAHLAGAMGKGVPGFLTQESFDKLHSPLPNSSYALGWVVENGVLIHDGSNTMWYAVAVIDPALNQALFAAINAADLEKNEKSRVIQAMQEALTILKMRAEANHSF